MRILIINDNGFEVGGVETYLRHLKVSLIENGHNVRVMTSEPPANSDSFNDISFNGVDQKSIFRVFPYIFNLSSYSTLKKVLSEFKPDIVHIHFFFYHTSPSILTLLKDIPTVMTFHAHELLAPVGTNYSDACQHEFYEYCIKCNGIAKYYPEIVKRWILNFYKKNIDLFIAPSKYYEEMYKKHNYKPVLRSPYGLVSAKDVKLTRDILRYNILFIGRLVKEKGAQYILNALPKILIKFPHTTLTIVGGGEYENELKDLTKKLGIEKNVLFTGKIPNSETHKYYEAADIIVALSDYPDNLPTVCIEAMKYGKPIIASDIGGFPDLVLNGKNGILVEPGNIQQVAQAVIDTFSDNELRKQMSREAYMHLKEYYLEKHIDKLIALYKEIKSKYV